MIEFLNVSKSYWTGERRKVILDQATFRIEGGQSMGILAKNGTGKTTLINMMAGLSEPDEGQIVKRSRVSFPLGAVAGVNDKLTGTENARYIGRLYGMDPDFFESYCRYVCDLEEYFDMPIKTYSSGMKQRFTYALMLGIDFDIYLIDEGMPTNTDVEFNKRAGLMLNERLKDATVVMVSHDPETVEKYCQTAAVLDGGRLHFFDTLEQAKAMYDYSLQQ